MGCLSTQCIIRRSVASAPCKKVNNVELGRACACTGLTKGTKTLVMRLTSLFSALFVLVGTSFSQIQQIAVNSAPAPEGYGVEVELYAEDLGIVSTGFATVDLTGFNVYRLYMTLLNAEDQVSAVSGDVLNPTYINTSTDFFQSAGGAGTSNGINPLFLGVFQDLAVDSWVTIGLEFAPDASIGEAPVQVISSDDQDFLLVFEQGGDIAIDDAIAFYIPLRTTTTVTRFIPLPAPHEDICGFDT